MEQKRLLIPALLLCAALGACTATPAPSASISPFPSASPAQTAPPASHLPEATSVPYTEESALKVFNGQNERNSLTGQTAAQTVLTQGDTNGLAAVILYTDENANNVCNLAYVYGNDVVEKVCFASNENNATRDFVIVADVKLEYLGEGVVTIAAQEVKTGDKYLFTVTGVPTETGTNFSMESAPMA